MNYYLTIASMKILFLRCKQGDSNVRTSSVDVVDVNVVVDGGCGGVDVVVVAEGAGVPVVDENADVVDDVDDVVVIGVAVAVVKGVVAVVVVDDVAAVDVDDANANVVAVAAVIFADDDDEVVVVVVVVVSDDADDTVVAAVVIVVIAVDVVVAVDVDNVDVKVVVAVVVAVDFAGVVVVVGVLDVDDVTVVGVAGAAVKCVVAAVVYNVVAVVVVTFTPRYVCEVEILCPIGYYCPVGTNTQVPCASGKQLSMVYFECGDGCPAWPSAIPWYCAHAGTYNDKPGRHTPCNLTCDTAPGYGCTSGSSTVNGSECVPGSYGTGGSAPCVLCPANTFGNASGLTVRELEQIHLGAWVCVSVCFFVCVHASFEVRCLLADTGLFWPLRRESVFPPWSNDVYKLHGATLRVC